MQTIHSVIQRVRLLAGGQYINYIKKIEGDDVEAELQQGVFNDVNEIGTSKKKRKKKKK
jgi:hypothetical protein